MIKGTELFVKALLEEQVDTIFGYPGGYAIDLFDALYDEENIRVVLPRHEQALIHEAEGYARATGKVGVCLVTSGPGATNLVTGIADASYDSIPLVCFTGQVNTDLIGNDAFQEVDIIGVTRSICKYGITVTDRKDLGRIIKEAFYIARSGKPGPVIIDLPKNIVNELGDDTYPDTVSIRGYKPNSGVHIGQLKKAVEQLKTAKKPVFLVGGGVNIARAGEKMTELAELTGIPVISTIMGRGAVPTNHPNYVGNVGLHGNYAANMAISECDVLFSIGTRFNDRITGKISEFAPHATIIHIDIESAAISRNIRVDIPVVGDAKEAITKIIELVMQDEEFNKSSIEKNRPWYEKIKGWEKEYPMCTRSADLEVKDGMISRPDKIIEAINQAYDEAILGLWKQWEWQIGSFYEYVGNYLGYRFCIRRAEVLPDDGKLPRGSQLGRCEHPASARHGTVPEPAGRCPRQRQRAVFPVAQVPRQQ